MKPTPVYSTATGSAKDQKPKPKDDAAQEPETPAQQKMTNALQEQRDLLAEFAKVVAKRNDVVVLTISTDLTKDVALSALQTLLSVSASSHTAQRLRMASRSSPL